MKPFGHPPYKVPFKYKTLRNRLRGLFDSSDGLWEGFKELGIYSSGGGNLRFHGLGRLGLGFRVRLFGLKFTA